MAWTATLYQVNKDSERPTAVILFTDGTKYKRLETIDLSGQTIEMFRNRVESMRINYERSFTFIDTLDPQTFVLTPTPTPDPTPEQQKQSQINIAKMALMQANSDFNLGLMLQADYDQKVADFLKLLTT